MCSFNEHTVTFPKPTIFWKIVNGKAMRLQHHNLCYLPGLGISQHLVKQNLSYLPWVLNGDYVQLTPAFIMWKITLFYHGVLYPVDETRLLFSHHFHAAKYEVPCPYCNTFFAVFTLTSTYQRKVKRWVTTVTVYFGSFSVQVVSHNYIVRLPNTKVTLMTCLHKTPLYCVTFSIVKRVNTA